MIPKTIHYCWFGNQPLPANLKKYVDGWKNKLPDYEIKMWNEHNFDINVSVFSKQAYENKKWAFVSDYVRLFVLHKYGGVYLDTDIEVVKDFSSLLNCQLLVGYEASGNLQAGVIGAEKGSQYSKMLLEYYDNHEFVKKDKSFDIEPIGQKVEKILKERFDFTKQDNPFLLDNNILVCPSRYFCPDLITEVNYIDNYTIHHGEGSWLPTLLKVKQKIFLLIAKSSILTNIYKHFKRRR